MSQYIFQYIFSSVHFYLCLFIKFLTTVFDRLIFLFILTPQGSHRYVCVCNLCVHESCVYVHSCMWSVCIHVYVFMLYLGQSKMCVIFVGIQNCVHICTMYTIVSVWYMCALKYVCSCMVRVWFRLEGYKMCVYMEYGWIYICSVVG